MPLSKHDSMVVTEIISAFGVLALLGIAIFLSLIFGEMKTANQLAEKNIALQMQEESDAETKKIGIKDLDEELSQALGAQFAQLGALQQASNEEIKFFMNKILAKNYSEKEIEELVTEFTAQQEALKKQAEEAAAKAAAEKPAE
jgi:hypothetical protein